MQSILWWIVMLIENLSYYSEIGENFAIIRGGEAGAITYAEADDGVAAAGGGAYGVGTKGAGVNVGGNASASPEFSHAFAHAFGWSLDEDGFDYAFDKSFAYDH